MGGHISGAHHNPAVTLAILTAGKMKTGMFQMGPAGCAAGYVTAQLLGSLVAGMFAYSISRDMDYNMGTPRVSRRASWTSAMSIEIIFTFFLALTVLNVATTRANEVCDDDVSAAPTERLVGSCRATQMQTEHTKDVFLLHRRQGPEGPITCFNRALFSSVAAPHAQSLHGSAGC